MTVAELQDLYGDDWVKPPKSFLSVFNQVQEQFITSGKWQGTDFVAQLTQVRGYISCGRGIASVLGATYCRNPIGIDSLFSGYIETGYGTLDPELEILQLTEAGVWPTQVAQTEAMVLRIRTESADDDGKIVRLHGVDEDGGQVFGDNSKDGLEIELLYPYVDVAYAVKLQSVDKDVTSGFVTVYELSGSTEYQIAKWEPTEQFPAYRRYATGTVTEPLDCLLRRCHVKLVARTDIVRVANSRANKLGLMAVFHEDAQNFDESGKCWGSAYSILNSEIKTYRGNSKRVAASFSPWGKKRNNYNRLR